MSNDVLSNAWKPLPPSPVTLIPLAEMVARIEAIRLEEAPEICPTCGSHAASETQVCTGPCGRRKALGLFRTRENGRTYRQCRACERERSAVAHRRRAIHALRRAS